MQPFAHKGLFLWQHPVFSTRPRPREPLVPFKSAVSLSPAAGGPVNELRDRRVWGGLLKACGVRADVCGG